MTYCYFYKTLPKYISSFENFPDVSSYLLIKTNNVKHSTKIDGLIFSFSFCLYKTVEDNHLFCIISILVKNEYD